LKGSALFGQQAFRVPTLVGSFGLE
jgi:hypothetical protein